MLKLHPAEPLVLCLSEAIIRDHWGSVLPLYITELLFRKALHYVHETLVSL